MTEQQALDLIKDALAEVAPDRADDFATLSADMTIEDLALDSVTTMEMIGVLEEKVDRTFPDEELPKVNALRDICTLLRTGKVTA